MIENRWSFSRYRAFVNCPKALWLEEHSNRQRSNLVSLNSLIGTSVHLSISYLIDNWSKGIAISNNAIKQVGIGYIRFIWENKKKNIIEYVNGTEIDDSLGLKFEKSLSSILDKFFNYIWPTFINEIYLTHENLFELNIKNYKILVKPDLVTKDALGNLVITDWKSSVSNNNLVDSFQILTYGLWACNFYSVDPSQVTLQVINLRTGRTVKGKFSKEQMNETFKTIEIQIKDLNKISQEQILPAKPEFNKCMRCIHLKFCNDGKKKLTTT